MGERALSTLALHHWHQLCLRLALLRRATGAQERQRGRVTMWTLRWQRRFWDVNGFGMIVFKYYIKDIYPIKVGLFRFWDDSISHKVGPHADR